MRPLWKTVLVFSIVVIATGMIQARIESEFELFFANHLKQSHPEVLAIATSDFEELISKFEEKKAKMKSEEAFLKYVFYTVHRKYLGQYKQYVALGEVFEKSRQYDCVTGTALYALVLDHFGIQYQVRETDFHVYLLAYADGKEYMFESTDPIYGITNDQKEIKARRTLIEEDAKRINAELAMSGVGTDQSDHYQAELIDNAVSLRELSGLHYYNLALAELNEQKYSQAYSLIQKAYQLYPSERIKQTASLIFALAFED